MSNRRVLVTETHLEDIADAIREKNGRSTETYTPGDMAEAISDIPTSATLVTKSVTANGTYDPQNDNADGYSLFTVNVSGGGGADLEGNLAPKYAPIIFPVSEGQGCIYEGEYYVATEDIATYEEFDDEKWTRYSASEQIYENAQDIKELQNICVRGGTHSISISGMQPSYNHDDITAGHIVLDWGFSTGDANNPPAKVSITTYDGYYVVTVGTVYVSGATITPTFVKIQNYT